VPKDTFTALKGAF